LEISIVVIFSIFNNKIPFDFQYRLSLPSQNSDKTKEIQAHEELEFAIFCIENIAIHLETDAEVKNGISDMHCMSDLYLAEDLQIEYLEQKSRKEDSKGASF
jgi:hypothetical protein